MLAMNGICLLKGISSDANWKGKDKVLHVRLYRYKIIITNFTWKENIIIKQRIIHATYFMVSLLLILLSKV
jgi:hypothetical protein